MVEAKAMQINVESALLGSFLQRKESVGDMTALRLLIKKQFGGMGSIDMMVKAYREKREKYLDTLKKVATYGVVRGALKYLDLLLECT